MAIIRVSEKCTGCGVCVKTCPQKILALDESKKMYIIDPTKCMSCFGCEDGCRFDAVFIKKGALPQLTEEEIMVEDHEILEPDYDVIIVGAGPSGLGTAISCAEQGLRTAVFERLPNREVSHHNDGGVLFSYPSVTSIRNKDGIFELPEVNFKMKNDFVHSQTEWISVEGPAGHSFSNEFRKGMVGYICSKDKLVHQLADEAQSRGAKLFYNTRVKDVIHEDGKISGIKLLDGSTVKSKVLVTADGILARFSAKSKIPVNSKAQGYIQYLTLFYERPEGLTSGFSYVMGDLNLDDDVPPSVACVGVGEHVEVSLIVYARKKFYTPKKPLEYYVRDLLKKDKRMQKFLGGHADTMKFITVKGTRLRLRELCKDIAVDGAVAVGDNWVSGAQLGNVNSIANGIYAGKEIKKAFDRNDFSKESLSSVSGFINKDTEMFANQIAKMASWVTDMDRETMITYFSIFHKINYPTMFFGTKKQIMTMMMGIMLRNVFKLMMNRKLFKYM